MVAASSKRLRTCLRDFSIFCHSFSIAIFFYRCLAHVLLIVTTEISLFFFFLPLLENTIEWFIMSSACGIHTLAHEQLGIVGGRGLNFGRFNNDERNLQKPIIKCISTSLSISKDRRQIGRIKTTSSGKFDSRRCDSVVGILRIVHKQIPSRYMIFIWNHIAVCKKWLASAGEVRRVHVLRVGLVSSADHFTKGQTLQVLSPVSALSCIK